MIQRWVRDDSGSRTKDFFEFGWADEFSLWRTAGRVVSEVYSRYRQRGLRRSQYARLRARHKEVARRP